MGHKTGRRHTRRNLDRTGNLASSHEPFCWTSVQKVVGDIVGVRTPSKREPKDISDHTPQQLPQDVFERAFSIASSSSAWEAHVGLGTDVRYTLSRLFCSFSFSMQSFLVIIADRRVSNKFFIPARSIQVSHPIRKSGYMRR